MEPLSSHNNETGHSNTNKEEEAGKLVSCAKTCNQDHHQHRHRHHHRREHIKSILWKEANYDPSSSSTIKKRSNYISWQVYFLSLAKLTSLRSKDPTRQIGACIVDSDNRIVGIGYNGFPRHCSDEVLPWSSSFHAEEGGTAENENNALHCKEWYMVRAEINAILNHIAPDVRNTTMYVYGSFPCNECAKFIVQAGIQEIVYMDHSTDDAIHSNDCHSVNIKNNNVKNNDKTNEEENSIKASRILLGLAGVKVTNYTDIVEESSKESIPPLTFIPKELRAQQKLQVRHKDTVGNQQQQQQSSITNHGNTNKNKNKHHANNDDNDNDNDNGDKHSISVQKTNITNDHRDLLIKEANFDPLNKAEHQHKRANYLSWDDYFMAVATLSAYRSKDPNTQVGAVIVDSNKCIIGIGYNGFPRGCSDDDLPWARRAENSLHTKYLYVVHAEVNAILNKKSKDCTGATLYVDLFPCNACAKVIIQSGIKEVVYLSDTYHNSNGCRASRIMFGMAGVKCRQNVPSVESINVDIFDDDQ
jgi:dCMP deaminase